MNSHSDDSPEMNRKVAIGQLELGLKNLHGDGVQQNHATAAFWFEQSARRGNAEAMRHLASLYFSGNGVPHSHADAYHWVRKSYEAGDLIATALLSEFHSLGIYVNRDPEGSLSLLKEAAFRGHLPSQVLLKDFRSWWKTQKSQGALMEANLAILSGDIYGHVRKQALAQTMSKKKFAALNAASLAKILTP